MCVCSVGGEGGNVVKEGEGGGGGGAEMAQKLTLEKKVGKSVAKEREGEKSFFGVFF